MSKIIDFSVDEDNMIVVNEYDGFGNVFCKKMKFFCGVFCDEYGCSEVEDIVCEGGFEEEEDEKKFEEEKEKIRKQKEYKKQKEYEYQQSILNKSEKPKGKTYVANKTAIRNLGTKFFNLYGHRCVICGEEHEEFLTLDHINDDGYKNGGHRGKEEYRKAGKTFSPDKYQVLCYNCNMSKNRRNMQKEYSRNRNYSIKLRERLFDMYGHECACCGEANVDNLTLDHVRNNGKELRKRMETDWRSTGLPFLYMTQTPIKYCVGIVI